jgi:glycerophosphoryl diester phosphodiesterase
VTRPRTRAPFLQERHAAGVLRTAHGGASRVAPDNTLDAILATRGHAIDLVEVDAHLTRDGQLLLWHDPQLVTPDGVHEIAAHTLAELRALEVPDGTLATLPDAIEAVRGHSGLMIDLKAPALEEPILAALRAANYRDVVVCGGYRDTLRTIHARRPDLGVSLTPDLPFYRDFAAGLAGAPFLDAVTVYWRSVGPELLRAAQEAGVLVLAWTVDHQRIADHLLALGIHGITSNNLDLLRGLSLSRAAYGQNRVTDSDSVPRGERVEID